LIVLPLFIHVQNGTVLGTEALAYMIVSWIVASALLYTLAVKLCCLCCIVACAGALAAAGLGFLVADAASNVSNGTVNPRSDNNL